MSDSIDYPFISVVIPSFNQGQYIEETILSIIGQNYPKLEIIVIDGGSTDNTIEILEKYSDKISHWHSKKDNGQADAINQGMAFSSGEVICWLNSDDFYLPKTLLDIGKRFCGKTKECYLIYGAALTINQSNGKLYSSFQSAAPFEETVLTYNDFIVQPSAFWTRKLWQCTGELNTKYNYVLDWDWFIRASKVTKFEYISKFYSVYRYHPLHKSSTGGAARRKEILEIVEKYSSDYWINLYWDVENEYSKLQKVYQLLSNFKIPKRHLLLPIFNLKLLRRLHRIRDINTVLNMYFSN